MTSSPLAIDARALSLHFGEGAARVDVLHGIDLALPVSQTLALLGPSGSGKSSLMAVLSGLERASAGTLFVAGTQFTGLDEDALALARRGRIGIVLQAFHLLPTMTALENVMTPLELAGTADARERALQELAAVGLGHRAGHYPAQLSGGEQQRVAMARALAPAPALILADEPTGNLDAETGEAIATMLFDRCAHSGASLIVITHDPALARRCQRVVTLSDGRIASDSSEQ